MDATLLGNTLIEWFRTLLAASDALDEAEEAETQRKIDDGYVLVDVDQGPAREAIVTNHFTKELIGVFPEAIVTAPTPADPWRPEWYSYDRLTDPNNTDTSSAIRDATDHMWEVADAKPFLWLRTLEPLDEVDEIREFLAQIDDHSP